MKEIQLKNKHHHFILKYIKSDKLDLFTNLLKAATDCTSSSFDIQTIPGRNDSFTEKKSYLIKIKSSFKEKYKF